MLSKKTTAKEVANDKAERIMLGVAVWCSFYRANPQRFCKDILNIELKMFQQVLIYLIEGYVHTSFSWVEIGNPESSSDLYENNFIDVNLEG